MNDTSTDSCVHSWVGTIDSDGVGTGEAHCEHCYASPSDVLATEGSLEMPCGHVLDEESHVIEHIDWSPIGEGAYKSCDPLMPEWSD
jgi:hypothetical protein